VILGSHPYNCEVQTAPLRPIGYHQRAWDREVSR
jgi:hypothetical protein